MVAYRFEHPWGPGRRRGGCCGKLCSAPFCHPWRSGPCQVVVRGLGWLGVPGGATAGTGAEAFQSSTRPRWAGPSVLRCSRAQSRWRPSVAKLGVERPSTHRRARPSCRSPAGRAAHERRGGSCGDRRCSLRACAGPRRKATDLSVAQAVEAEREDLAGDRDLGDLAAAAP
jgi:hypothetical protein